MAKITTFDGNTIEGTVEEITELMEKFGVKKTVEAEEDEFELSAGDYVVFSDEEWDMDVMENVRRDKAYKVFVDSEGEHYVLDENGNKRYSLLIFEEFAVVPEPILPLAVGDYAVVIGVENTRKSRGSHGFTIGDIVELTDEFNAGGGFRVSKVNGEYVGANCMNTEDLRKATDEEVATAKAQAESNAKDDIFTANGRKTNEYRKGDIIRYEGDNDDGIYAVSHTESDKVYFFCGKFDNNTEYMHLADIEPIVFAENRLDRN